jgi:pSer/pThr/pTyr-binding forkhead associated (FHA) protein
MDATPGAADHGPQLEPTLTLLNGRQRGVRRPLDRPVTVIGQAPGCDVRLNAGGVSPWHCVIGREPDGLWLRDLDADRGTRVNGRPAGEGPLADGDVLTIGPFRFRVDLPPPGPAPAAEQTAASGDRDQPADVTAAESLQQKKLALRLEMEDELRREKEALRGEMEARLRLEVETLRADAEALLRPERTTLETRAADLDVREAALAQEQEQLRQRWLELDRHHEQARLELEHARDALRVQVAAVVAQQVALNEEETRLQQRRTALAQQETQLVSHLEERRRALVQLHDQTRQARAALQQERADFDAATAQTRRDLALARQDVDDNRRQVQAERRRLAGLWRRMRHRYHRHWAAERAAFRAHEDDLARQRLELDRAGERLQQERATLQQAVLRFNGEAELGRRQLRAAWQQFADDRDAWDEQRNREQASLHDYRQRIERWAADLQLAEQELHEQQQRWHHDRTNLEQEMQGLETRVRNQRRKLMEQERALVHLDPAGGGLPPRTELPAEPTTTVHLEPAVADRLTEVERLAAEVADQRLHLAEQLQRLTQVRVNWEEERDRTRTELADLARELTDRGRVLHLEEERLQQRKQEAVHLRMQLESWQSRLAAREAAWEWERQRLLEEVQSREALARRRLQALGDVHQRWLRRRRQELARWQAEQASGAKVRRVLLALREQWLQRRADLEKDQRNLAERTLALEQYRQEVVRKSAQPAATEKRLDRLQRRWSAASAAAARDLAREREALLADNRRLEAGFQELTKAAAELAARDAELAGRRLDWERQQLLAQDELDQARQRLQLLLAQRDRYEAERRQLRDEIDRLARLLIPEDERPALLEHRAA